MGVLIRLCEGAMFSGKDVPGHARRHSIVSCAKTAEQIELLFGFWATVGRMKRRRGDAALCQITLTTCYCAIRTS